MGIYTKVITGCCSVKYFENIISKGKETCYLPMLRKLKRDNTTCSSVRSSNSTQTLQRVHSES